MNQLSHQLLCAGFQLIELGLTAVASLNQDKAQSLSGRHHCAAWLCTRGVLTSFNRPLPVLDRSQTMFV